MKKVTWIALGLGILLIAGMMPLITGWIFENNYRHLIAFYNSEGAVNIQIKEYHRGWLTSHSKLYVQVTQPDFQQYLKMLKLDSSTATFTVDQTIQHGPVIFNHPYPSNFFSWFGLAAFHNTYYPVAQVKSAISSLSPQPVELQDDDFVSMLGTYYKSFSVPPFKYFYPDEQLTLYFNQGIKGTLRFYPGEKRIVSNIYLFDLKMDDGENFIAMPNTSIRFNQAEAPSGLWLGQLAVYLSHMDWRDTTGMKLAIDGFDFSSKGSESRGKISDWRSLDVDNVKICEQTIGPVHFQLSASGLDVNAIKDLITTYRRIMREGERYESQLQFKMSMMLPAVFKDGAELKLDGLQVMTPAGRFQVNGEMNWSNHNAAASHNVLELVQNSDAQANMRVSKSLTDRMLRIALSLPYFREITNTRRQELLDMQMQIGMLDQQNFLMISSFVASDWLTEEAGLTLLQMQKNENSFSSYESYVKDLLLKKQISLPVSYLLSWKYSQVMHQSDMLDQELELDQENRLQQLQSQIQEFVKEGYVTIDDGEYVVSLKKNDDKIKLNGKELE